MIYKFSRTAGPDPDRQISSTLALHRAIVNFYQLDHGIMCSLGYIYENKYSEAKAMSLYDKFTFVFTNGRFTGQVRRKMQTYQVPDSFLKIYHNTCMELNMDGQVITRCKDIQ